MPPLFFLDSCVGPCSLGFSPIMKLRSRWVCLRYRSSRYARCTSKLLSFLRFKWFHLCCCSLLLLDDCFCWVGCCCGADVCVLLDRELSCLDALCCDLFFLYVVLAGSFIWKNLSEDHLGKVCASGLMYNFYCHSLWTNALVWFLSCVPQYGLAVYCSVYAVYLTMYDALVVVPFKELLDLALSIWIVLI